MVLSLFPKRRRRRCWLRQPQIGEVADPPSFSDLKPELTAPIEDVRPSEEPEPQAMNPLRSTRSSAVRSQAAVAQAAGERESRHGTALETESLVESPQLAHRNAEGSFEQTLEADNLHRKLPAPLEHTRCQLCVRRRSSRLHEIHNSTWVVQTGAEPCGKLPSPPPTPPRTQESSATQTREGHGSFDPLSTGSAREENSNYDAFVHGMISVGFVKNSTVRQESCEISLSKLYNISEEADLSRDETLEAHNRVDESDKKPRDGESKLKADLKKISRKEFASRSIQVTISKKADTNSETTTRKPVKAKAQARDARTSTTGLDRYVRRSRRKKSTCVQIDLDRTTAFARILPDDANSESSAENDKDFEPVAACQDSLPVNANIKTLAKDSLPLHQVPRIPSLADADKRDEAGSDAAQTGCDERNSPLGVNVSSSRRSRQQNVDPTESRPIRTRSQSALCADGKVSLVLNDCSNVPSSAKDAPGISEPVTKEKSRHTSPLITADQCIVCNNRKDEPSSLKQRSPCTRNGPKGTPSESTANARNGGSSTTVEVPNRTSTVTVGVLKRTLSITGDVTQTASSITTDVPKVASSVTIEVPKGASSVTIEVPKVASSVTVDVPKVASSVTIDVPKVASSVTIDAPGVASSATIDVPKVASSNAINVPKAAASRTAYLASRSLTLISDVPRGNSSVMSDGAGAPSSVVSGVLSRTTTSVDSAYAKKPSSQVTPVKTPRTKNARHFIENVPERPKRLRVTPRRQAASTLDIQSIAQRIRDKLERKRIVQNTIYRRVNLIYEGLWEDFLQKFYPVKWAKVKDEWMARKAEKRIDEEQRGLGHLDADMEIEVQKGTELGAAKYFKDFEERAANEREKLRNRLPKRNKPSVMHDESRRQSRRLRELEPL